MLHIFKRVASAADQENAENRESLLRGGDEIVSWESGANEGQLAVDVYQSKDDIVIQTAIAGVRSEDVDVLVQNDMVTIRGERHRTREDSEEDYFYQECHWGTFSRSIILPVEIYADKAQAIFKYGVLTIRLQKAMPAQSLVIEVEGEE